MSGRELVVLGTASQVPTRERTHNGLLLRWGRRSVLIDPGEGTQRQLRLAGLTVTPIRDILLTHLHADHCLGLPGVLQRLSLDGAPGPVHVRYPAAGHRYVERLRYSTPYEDRTEVVLAPTEPGWVAAADPDDADGLGLRAIALSHGPRDRPMPTLAWRLGEPDGQRFDPAALARLRVPPEARTELARTGSVTVDGRRVERDAVSRHRPGQHIAVVMDTRDGAGAREAAADVDLLVIEATFLDDQRALADAVGHLTAGQAARLAWEVGARRVVLTHLSQRYPDGDGHLAEARAAAPDLDVTVAADLDRVALPPRR